MIDESLPLLTPCDNFVVPKSPSEYNETQMIDESLPLLSLCDHLCCSQVVIRSTMRLR